MADHNTFQFEPIMPIMNTSDLLWTSMGNSTMHKIIYNMLVQHNKDDLEPGAFKLASGKIIDYKAIKMVFAATHGRNS